MKSQKFVALLRGINVGGHLVKMDNLKHIFEEMGFSSIRTVIASGNVIFETETANKTEMKEKIEQALLNKLGYKTGTIIRSEEEIKTLIDSDPFKKVSVTPETRLYITFLQEIITKKPSETVNNDFKILNISKGEIAIILTLSENKGTVDLMGFLEKEFGREITTRNWNTVLKISKAFEN